MLRVWISPRDPTAPNLPKFPHQQRFRASYSDRWSPEVREEVDIQAIGAAQTNIRPPKKKVDSSTIGYEAFYRN
jgi:hypothetical protein